MLDSGTERGYTNETIGNAVWKGQDPWRIEGKLKLGKKKNLLHSKLVNKLE